jgi:sulfur carrier protein
VIVDVNGKATELQDGATVQTVLAGLDLDSARRGVAVAVDAEVVPRTQWEGCRLTDGARVEVLTAVQGG